MHILNALATLTSPPFTNNSNFMLVDMNRLFASANFKPNRSWKFTSLILTLWCSKRGQKTTNKYNKTRKVSVLWCYYLKIKLKVGDMLRQTTLLPRYTMLSLDTLLTSTEICMWLSNGLKYSCKISSKKMKSKFFLLIFS